MTHSTGKRKFHFKSRQPNDPAVHPFGEWSHDNRNFFAQFRNWLEDTGYSAAALELYSVAARQALGFLDKPYWTIDPETDLDQVWLHFQERPFSAYTLADYHKGLLKFADYLRFRSQRPSRARPIHWAYYTGSLPTWLQADVRSFMQNCQRNWPSRQIHETFRDALGQLTRSLRWMAAHFTLQGITDLTPQVWFAYLDYRLASGIRPSTINGELSSLKRLVFFLQDQDRQVCERFLLVGYLNHGPHLPKDAPVEQLRLLLQQIQAEAVSRHAGKRRCGLLDYAWVLLMLHAGLRTGEVRRLLFGDIDWQSHRVRIEQSKGLQDRIVPLSQAALQALQAYLEVRGPRDALPEQVFIYRHQPLSQSYCSQRLKTYGRRGGFFITPHQLRHSAATLLLNAGAPILTVQAILGHRQVDTTLGYARLYDGTVAADYYQAMAIVERRLALPEDRLARPPGIGQLVALLDSLQRGALNEAQSEAVRQLRAGMLALAERENVIQDVKVQQQGG